MWNKQFLDANLTKPVPRALALTGEYAELFVDWEYHILHCVYLWRKLHRAMESNAGMFLSLVECRRALFVAGRDSQRCKIIVSRDHGLVFHTAA